MAGETDRQSRYLLNLSWSLGYEAQPEVFSRTSMLGVGFLLFAHDSLNIQNHSTYSSGIMNREDSGIKLYQHVLTEKVTVGVMSRNGLFRPYGLLEGRIGLCGLSKHSIFENPVIGKVGIGTGLDIFPLDTWSFFFELGFLGNIYHDEFIMQQRFEIGVKTHLVPLRK